MNRRTAVYLLLFAPQNKVSDDEIYDNVRRRLANDRDVRGGALQVDVKEGVVSLRGRVEEEKHKEKAEKLTRKVKGVREVKNELTVTVQAR